MNTILPRHTPAPPAPGQTPPRFPYDSDIRPADVLAALEILSRRQQARRARISSISRLRGAA